jgi:ribosome biogenesis SPOUT family RNA methylase Rps3
LRIVVEHMEKGVSRWLLAEYREVIKVCRDNNVEVIFTNVKDPFLFSLLFKEEAKVEPDEGWKHFNLVDAILLDPEAKKVLEPWEARRACCIIVGGIMGDYPPQGRTRVISSFYTNVAKRSLGPHQFSVDGAVKVALKIYKGMRLKEIELVGPPIKFSLKGLYGYNVEVILPYVYPAKPDGSPDVPSEILSLLERGIMWDEIII